MKFRGMPNLVRFSEQDSVLPRVEVFRAGTHRGKTYTIDDLDDIVEAFDQYSRDEEGQASLRVPAVLGHDEAAEQDLLRQTGLPAAAWVSDLQREGDTLVARLEDVAPQVMRLIAGRRYRRVSAEVYDQHPPGLPSAGSPQKMLRRVAFLGGEIPQVKTLADIPVPYSESFSERPSGVLEIRPVQLRTVKTVACPQQGTFMVFSESVALAEKSKKPSTSPPEESADLVLPEDVESPRDDDRETRAEMIHGIGRGNAGRYPDGKFDDQPALRPGGGFAEDENHAIDPPKKKPPREKSEEEIEPGYGRRIGRQIAEHTVDGKVLGADPTGVTKEEFYTEDEPALRPGGGFAEEPEEGEPQEVAGSDEKKAPRLRSSREQDLRTRRGGALYTKSLMRAGRARNAANPTLLNHTEEPTEPQEPQKPAGTGGTEAGASPSPLSQRAQDLQARASQRMRVSNTVKGDVAKRHNNPGRRFAEDEGTPSDEEQQQVPRRPPAEELERNRQWGYRQARRRLRRESTDKNEPKGSWDYAEEDEETESLNLPTPRGKQKRKEDGPSIKDRIELINRVGIRRHDGKQRVDTETDHPADLYDEETTPMDKEQLLAKLQGLGVDTAALETCDEPALAEMIRVLSDAQGQADEEDEFEPEPDEMPPDEMPPEGADLDGDMPDDGMPDETNPEPAAPTDTVDMPPPGEDDDPEKHAEYHADMYRKYMEKCSEGKSTASSHDRGPGRKHVQGAGLTTETFAKQRYGNIPDETGASNAKRTTPAGRRVTEESPGVGKAATYSEQGGANQRLKAINDRLARAEDLARQREATERQAAIVSRLNALVAAGKVLPAERDAGLDDALLAIPAEAVVKFSENGRVVECPVLDRILEALQARPVLVRFSERIPAAVQPKAGSEDAEVARIEAHYEQFSEAFERIGVTKADIVAGFKAERKSRPKVTAADYLNNT